MSDDALLLKALIQVFGRAKVDAFPAPLVEAMRALFERGRSMGVCDEKAREEAEGEAQRDAAWKEAYDLGWNDCTVESRADWERQIDDARQEGYDTAIDEQIQHEIPRIGFPKKETA